MLFYLSFFFGGWTGADVVAPPPPPPPPRPVEVWRLREPDLERELALEAELPEAALAGFFLLPRDSMLAKPDRKPPLAFF